MIKKIAQQISNYCDAHGVATEKKEIIAYGLECLLMEIIGDIILFSAAYFLGIFLHSLLWTVGLVSVRYFAGGYHAGSPAKCLMISTANGLLFPMIIKFAPINKIVILLMIVMSIGLLFWAAPVESTQIKSTESRRNERKNKTRIMVTVASIVAIILMFFFPLWTSGSLISGTLSAALACFIEKIKKLIGQ